MADEAPAKRKSRGWAKLTRSKRARFLHMVEEGALVGAACEAIGCSRQAIHKLKRRDPAFAEALECARGNAISVLEDEAMRRGLASSDALLLKMMQRLDPKNWTPRSDIRNEIAGDKNNPLALKIDATRDALNEKLDRIAQRV